jgi:hypothetical protein
MVRSAQGRGNVLQYPSEALQSRMHRKIMVCTCSPQLKFRPVQFSEFQPTPKARQHNCGIPYPAFLRICLTQLSFSSIRAWCTNMAA